MERSPGERLRRIVTYNGAHKMVALMVTFVLWVTIQGRKDMTMEQTFPVQYMVPQGAVIENRVAKRIRVRLMGSKVALKKISTFKDPVRIDLTGLDEGWQQVEISRESLQLPLGVQIIAIEPKLIHAKIKKNKQKGDEDAATKTKPKTN